MLFLVKVALCSSMSDYQLIHRNNKLKISNLSSRLFPHAKFDIVLKKCLFILSWFVLLLFAAALLTSIFIPVYSDEVATKFLMARVFDEDWTLVSLFPQCKSSFVSSLPLTWYPAAAIYGFIYSKLDLLGLRIAGIGGATAWAMVMIFWSFNIVQFWTGRLYVVAGLLALNSFGVLPFILALARPEQILILCIAYYCVVPLFLGFEKTNLFWSRGLVVVTFLLITSVFYFSHPKALFFTPLVLASAISSVRLRHWQYLILLIFFTFATAYQSYDHAKLFGQCEEAPILSKAISDNTLSPSLLISNPKVFFIGAIKNLLIAPNGIIKHVPLQQTYQSGWLPPTQDILDDSVVKALGTITNLLFILSCFAVFFFTILKVLREIKERKITTQTTMAATLALGLLGHAALYNAWHFYTPGLIFPALIILALLMWGKYFEKLSAVSSVRITLACLLVFAILNLCALLANVVPQIIKQSEFHGASIKDQWLSVSPFNFDMQKTTIRSLAHQCNIEGDGSSRLVVDHSTYYAFDRLREPIHVLYISEEGFGGDIKGREIIPFLKEIKSPGIIARCDYIPPALRDTVKRLDGYCCINELELSQH
jgi:hypothetical protein